MGADLRNGIGPICGDAACRMGSGSARVSQKCRAGGIGGLLFVPETLLVWVDGIATTSALRSLPPITRSCNGGLMQGHCT